MVTRGAAPSSACPRCGEVAPASGGRLVTCASCKLSFDPSAERPVSIRRNRGAKLIDQVKITREPACVTLRSAFERRTGLVILAGGLGIVTAAVLLGLTPLGIIAGVVGSAISYLGFAYAGTHIIRVDRDQLSAGRLLLRRSRVGLADVGDIAVGAVSGRDGEGTYYVAAHNLLGPQQLLFVTKSEELADHVARVIKDAIATMPPKPLEATEQVSAAPPE